MKSIKTFYSIIAKNFLIASLFLTFYGSLEARTLSPEEAWSRALKGNDYGMMKKMASDRRNSLPEFFCVYGESDTPRFYVFTGRKEGFMVVPSDDGLAPVIGYGDGILPSADVLPPALLYWLDFIYDVSYDDSKEEMKVNKESARGNWEPVAPICQTKWNQLAPYNNMCPVYDGSSRCTTGCVATACAQIMYAHRHPLSGSGSVSYYDEVKGEMLELQADFYNAHYDWNNMRLIYSAGYSDREAEAVALLMSHIGMASGMDYAFMGTNQSAVSLYDASVALLRNFGYSSGIRYRERFAYTSGEWESILYGNLREGLPVLYSGSAPADGSHCFVCDGYDGKGMYHFNWGWGGVADGYFLLGNLRPEVGGAGSSSSNNYSYSQVIVENIRPASVADKVTPSIVAEGRIRSSVAWSEPWAGVTISLEDMNYTGYNGFFNYTPNVDGFSNLIAGVKLESASDGQVYYIEGPHLAVSNRSGFYTYDVRFDREDIPEGRYVMCPAVRLAGEGNPWSVVSLDSRYERSMDLELTAKYMKILGESTTEAVPVARLLTIPYAIGENIPFDITLELLSPYGAYDSEISLLFVDIESGEEVYESQPIQITVGRGKKLHCGFTSLVLPQPGYYSIYVIDKCKGLAFQKFSDIMAHDKAGVNSVDCMNVRMEYCGNTQSISIIGGESCKVTVTDVHGRAVLCGDIATATGSLDVSTLHPGIYIASAEGMWLRFVKK